MCYCCHLLKKDDLVPPQELAKAWIEASNSEPPEHDEVIIQELLKKLEDEGYTDGEACNYVIQCQEETIRLMSDLLPNRKDLH